jgi:hypothetical protein
MSRNMIFLYQFNINNFILLNFWSYFFGALSEIFMCFRPSHVENSDFDITDNNCQVSDKVSMYNILSRQRVTIGGVWIGN